MPKLNETHDPARRSWVESANADGCGYPIQNLPYGVVSFGGGQRRIGVAIGERILDLTALEEAGFVRPTESDELVFDTGSLNAFMALPQRVWSKTRAVVSDLLETGNPTLRDDAGLAGRVLLPLDKAEMHLPIFVRSFTDFYASKEHATNVGSMFRDPKNALMPNWLHIPIGYNGRASTVVVSGTPIHRPLGQLKPPSEDEPHFGACKKFDIELEMGAIVGTPNAMGQPVTTAQAYDMIFGYVLLNDWSARDVQVWEYQPLGPFQSKSFGTTISPWVVTREALEPFRCPAPERLKPLLPYLQEQTPNNLDVDLEVRLTPKDGQPTVISRTNFKGMYYSSAQQLAHHASSGCAMCTGDLLGSGTISGTEAGTLGSLLELTWNGRDPITVDGGTRTFIEDFDTLTLSGWCEGDGYRIGFGACSGQVLPAPAFDP